MHSRWGPERRDDFWTSLAHGEVETPELRAMMLLESVCDEYRFTLYSFTAEMPAMGNATGAMYVIQKQGGVIELDSNGTPCGHWCISIGPHSPVPGTDNVVVLKAMIEGEENEFRRIGNRSTFHGERVSDAPGVVAPHIQGLIPRDQAALARTLGDRTGELSDLFDLPDVIEVLEIEYGERESNAALRMARIHGQMTRAAEDWISPDRFPAEWEGMRMGSGLMELRNRLNGGRRVRYDPRAFADLDMDPLQELNLYGEPELPDDLDHLRRHREREEHAFLGVEVEDAPRGHTARLRRAIEQNVMQEFQGAVEPDFLGIRLRDGALLNWDPAEAQDVYMRTGIVVADEIHRMNNEGYNAEMIRFAMLEYFGVHQITDGGFGQYLDGPTVGGYLQADNYHPGPLPRRYFPRNAVVRPVGNGQFMYL